MNLRPLVLAALSIVLTLPAVAHASAASCPLGDARAKASESLAVGDTNAALAALDCALSANYRDLNARADRLVTALQAGRYGTAATDASTLRDLDRGRFDSLVTTAATSSSSNPADLNSIALLALLHWADARDDLALRDYQTILASQPTHVFAILFRGSSLLYMNDDVRASADFQQAVNLDPNNPDVYSVIGSTYQQVGNFYDALMALDHALAINPQDARSHYFRGMALFNNGDMADARAEFTSTLSSDPRYLNAWYDRARASYFLSDQTGAMSDLDQALTIDASFDLALVFRGTLHEWAGERDRATSDFFAYTVALDPSLINGGALSPNTPTTVALDTRVMYRFTFQGQAGAMIDLAAQSAQQQADPVLVLLGTDGQTPLAGSDDAAPTVHDALIDGLSLPETGVYTVLVTHSDSNSSGPVVVTLSLP